ncbi:unnamed protein product, partial [Ixodes hexagonus]
LPDGRYCDSQGVPTSSSSSGGVFFPDVGSGMADPMNCPMGYSHGSLYFTGDMQYTGKGQATDNPQTPQTPTSIPDIILTGPNAEDAALLKSALQQRQHHSLKNDPGGGHPSPLGSFDSSDLFSTEEALRAGLDPIDIDGLQILTDPNMAWSPRLWPPQEEEEEEALLLQEGDLRGVEGDDLASLVSAAASSLDPLPSQQQRGDTIEPSSRGGTASEDRHD